VTARGRIGLGCALAIVAALSATAAWPAQDISSEVRQFTLLGDLSYSPAYTCDAAGRQLRTCSVSVVDIDPPKLPTRSVVYTDAQGESHYGRIVLDFTSYTLRNTVVFERKGEADYVPVSIKTPEGRATALWSMSFPDSKGTSYIGGTLSTEDIRLSETADGKMRLLARFGVKVSVAQGPLTGAAGTATGACPTVQACTTTIDVTFPVTPATLMRPPDNSGANLAAAPRKTGVMKVRLRRGPPQVEIALGKAGRLGPHQRRLGAVAAPRSACVAHVQPLATSTRGSSPPRYDIPARAGATGYIYFPVDDIDNHGPKGRTVRDLARFLMKVDCQHAGVSATPATRTVTVARR
jgi:hypothetical protein